MGPAQKRSFARAKLRGCRCLEDYWSSCGAASFSTTTVGHASLPAQQLVWAAEQQDAVSSEMLGAVLPQGLVL
jgi:hypothetical protein